MTDAVQATKDVDSKKTAYNSKLQDFKEQFITGTRKQIDDVDTSVSGVLSAIPDKIKGVLEATSDAMDLMRTVLKLGSGVEPSPIEDIWLVYGKDQVNAAMMGLLSRTKRSATTVSPNMDWNVS